MNEPTENFDIALDRLLAARAEPAVPADLSRRIVVRTANMTQFGVQFGSPVPEPRLPRAERSAQRAWNGRNYWLGGALAASFAALLAGSVAPRPRDTGDIPAQSASGPRAMPAPARMAMNAQPPRVAKPAPAPSGAKAPSAEPKPSGTPVETIAHQVELADESAPAPHAAAATRKAGNAAAGAAGTALPAMHLARADSPVPSPRSGVRTFTLAANPAAPERVYGPVLDTDTIQYRASPGPGTTIGAAFASAGAGSPGPGGGPG